MARDDTATDAPRFWPFTVDESALISWRRAPRFCADTLVGQHVAMRQQPSPHAVTAAFTVRWLYYFDDARVRPAGSPLLNDPTDGYALTARVRVTQGPGTAGLSGSLALYARWFPALSSSTPPGSDDLLLCSSDVLLEVAGDLLDLPAAPRAGCADLRFGAARLTAVGADYWPSPQPFYLGVDLVLDLQHDSAGPDMLQGSARLRFVGVR